MKHGYTGAEVPSWCPIAVHEGWVDARSGSFYVFDMLYRRPLWKRVGYKLGYLVGDVFRD